MTTVTLKLRPPNVLPAEGVTAVAFKVWRNAMIEFVEQELTNSMFFPTGCYMNWTPRNENADGRRIRELHETNLEKVEIAALPAAVAPAVDQKPAKLATLLLKRNAQLSEDAAARGHVHSLQ